MLLQKEVFAVSEQVILYRNGDLRLAYALYPTPDIEGENRPSLHTHPRLCEILCIFRGKGTFHVAGTGYPITDNCFIITRPGESHYTELDPSAPYERAVIYFSPALLDGIDPERVLLQAFFDRESGLRNQYIPEGEEIIRQIRKMLATPQRLNIIWGMINVLQELNRLYHEEEHKPVRQTLEQRIVRYINEHPQEQYTTESLCAQFNISRAPLYRRFKKATGASVGEYINSRRVLMAQQMLLTGQKPMDVCYKCGFQDYSTFYRAYRKYVGHSPSAEESASL